MSETVLFPHAKINLFLDVGPPRADGYHDIVSVFQEIDLQDMIEIEVADGADVLTCSDKTIPLGSENTLLCALEIFRGAIGDVPPLSINLVKRIPTQAGLGGGSSDAAALLKFLWKEYSPQQPLERMIEVAARVGSDIPFFLTGGTCLVKGRGELVTSLPCLPPHPVLILHPQVQVSTAEAYRALDAKPVRRHPDPGLLLNAIEDRDWTGVYPELFNIFESVCLEACPTLAELYDYCKRTGFSKVLLAGSGSNLIILDPDEAALKVLQEEMGENFPETATTLTYTTDRDQ